MPALLQLLLSAATGPVVFIAPDGFVVASRSGVVIEKITTIAGMRPLTLTVSPKDDHLAFTGQKDGAPDTLLFIAPRTGNPANQIGHTTGFHTQPSFSDDGNWLFFIYHVSPEGMAWGQNGREYGQIWKSRTDGTSLTRITTSAGCKLSPDAHSGALVVAVHTDCNGTWTIEEVISGRLLASRSDRLLSFPRRAPSGDVAFVRRGADSSELIVRRRSGEFSVLPLPSAERVFEVAAGEGAQWLVQVGWTVLVLKKDGREFTQVFSTSEVVND